MHLFRTRPRRAWNVRPFEAPLDRFISSGLPNVPLGPKFTRFALKVHQTSASTKHIFCLLPFLSLFTYHDYDGNNVDDASLSISGGAPPPTLATIGARRVRCQPEGA